jgi:hypothetical protein
MKGNYLLSGLLAVCVGLLICDHSPAYAETSKPLASLENQYVHFDIATNWDMHTTGGDPATTADDLEWMHYQDGGTSLPDSTCPYWGIMVDVPTNVGDSWMLFPNSGSTIGIWANDAGALIGSTPYGTQTSGYYVDSARQIISGTYIPTITAGSGTGLNISYAMEARLLRDTVRFKFTITNGDDVAHLLGLMSMLGEFPTALGSSGTSSCAITSNGDYIVKPMLYSSSDVPDEVEFADSVSNPALVTRHIYNGQGATPPDEMAVAALFNNWIYGDDYVHPGIDTWLYSITDTRDIVGGSSGAFWKPRLVAPGESYTVVNYFGLGDATSNFSIPNSDDPECVLAVEGPRSLQYQYDSAGNGSLNATQVTITAYLMNLQADTDDNNVAFTLVLPSGLTLDSTENGAYTKSVTKIGAGCHEGSVSWVVDVDPSAAGALDYSVSVSGAQMNGGSVTREIYVPAQPSVSLSSGWHMLSVPFKTTTANTSTTCGLSNNFWNYDSSGSGSYTQAGCFTSGLGYWVHLNQPTSLTMQSNSNGPLYSAYDCYSTDQVSDVTLQQGWNIIGNPYVYDLPASKISFYYQNSTLDMDTAVADGVVQSIMYWWDPSTAAYKWGNATDTIMEPWQGYWIYAAESGVQMHFGTAVKLGGSVSHIGSSTGGGTTPGS